jgi:hypothetical protein
MKGVGRRFGSAPSGCERVAHGGADQGVVAARVSEGGRRHAGGPTWAGEDRELGQHKKNPKESQNGLPTRSGPKCKLGFRMDF